MDELPLEMIHHIFGFLDAKSLARTEELSSRYSYRNYGDSNEREFRNRVLLSRRISLLNKVIDSFEPKEFGYDSYVDNLCIIIELIESYLCACLNAREEEGLKGLYLVLDKISSSSSSSSVEEEETYVLQEDCMDVDLLYENFNVYFSLCVKNERVYLNLTRSDKDFMEKELSLFCQLMSFNFHSDLKNKIELI
jgi:hypothetical protein